MEPVLITSEALKKLLQAWPFQCENFLPIPRDKTYAAVPKEWFPQFVNWCRANPLERYSEEFYDCDDMAADRVADAGRAFRQHAIAKAAPAFLPCQIKIVPTSDYFGAQFEFNRGGHEPCIVWADDQKFFIYEPQANAFKDLAELLDNHIVGELSFVGL